ncbi:MAG TPA: hypothetical protein VFW22_16315 [Pseudolabrys sp.]|nr:hypothetical protein [Pseudolabrys sp.]
MPTKSSTDAGHPSPQWLAERLRASIGPAESVAAVDVRRLLEEARIIWPGIGETTKAMRVLGFRKSGKGNKSVFARRQLEMF